MFLGLIIIGSIVFSGAVSAATINVNNGTPNAIGKAISTAHAGDTLNLSAGRYKEHNLAVTKSLTISGSTNTGRPSAEIDGQSLGTVFSIGWDVDVTLQNLIITNGKTINGFGGGIYNKGNLKIKNCKITQNTAFYGGGIYSHGTLNVTNSRITSNTATQDGGGIYNVGTFTMTNSYVNYNTATKNGGGIDNELGKLTMTNSYVIYNTATEDGGGIINICDLTSTGSNINGNTAKNGGGIYNDGGNACLLKIINSNVNSNKATSGGAIYNTDYGKVSVTSSSVTSNTAKSFGGALYNPIACSASFKGCKVTGNYAGIVGGAVSTTGTLNVNSCTFINNGVDTTGKGGVFSNGGPLTVIGCNFGGNNTAAFGNVLYNIGSSSTAVVFNFNRFYANLGDYDMFGASGPVDARYNWWGSNNNPSNHAYGTVNITPWLVLNVDASPTVINYGNTSVVVANLWYDSKGSYHNPVNGHLIDGLPVRFTTTLGSITSPVALVNGAAKSTFTAGKTSGTTITHAILDNQSVLNLFTAITITPLHVNSIDPAKGAVNVQSNKKITVTYNEKIKPGSNYLGNLSIELKSMTGKLIPINKFIKGNVLTITPAKTNLPESLYTLILHKGFLSDLAGNPSPYYSSTFSVGTSPTITSSNPANGAVNVAINKPIKVTFSETIKTSNISNSVKSPWFELKDGNGKTVTITSKSISGNMLIINHAILHPLTKYVLIIHTGAVKDLAGNPVAYSTIKFTTGE